MNIKPTKKKVLWSIIIALIVNAASPLITWLTTTVTWPLIQNYENASKLTGISAPSNINTLTSYLGSQTNIIVFIIELILVYLIWSLFQRKRGSRINLNAKK
jgi:hypothetical protein